MRWILTVLLISFFAGVVNDAAAVNDVPQAAAPKVETKIPQSPPAIAAAKTSEKRGPLRSRLTIHDLPVSATIDAGTGYDNPASFWDGKLLRPVIFAPQPDGGAKIGWTDTEGTIHITPLDKKMRRCGVDMLIEKGSLRDLVAHDDGSAVLVLQEGGMYLIRLRNQETVFQKKLVSNWCRDIHWGSVAWNGQIYGTYFAVHSGGHEGDALRYVSADGEILDGGWTWGVSHSIDMRLSAAGEQFVPLALSDAYPGTGFYFNHNAKRISYTWGDFSGGTGGRIGGLVSLGDKMFVAFSSKQGDRKHWSAALADFAQQPPHQQSVHKYLEDADADQLNVKIGRYGSDRILVSWLEAESWERKFQLYDSDANPLGTTEVLPVRASPRADFKQMPDGGIAWAHGWSEGGKTLKIIRLDAVTKKSFSEKESAAQSTSVARKQFGLKSKAMLH
jgi:hypothetical protein